MFMNFLVKNDACPQCWQIYWWKKSLCIQWWSIRCTTHVRSKSQSWLISHIWPDVICDEHIEQLSLEELWQLYRIFVPVSLVSIHLSSSLCKLACLSVCLSVCLETKLSWSKDSGMERGLISIAVGKKNNSQIVLFWLAVGAALVNLEIAALVRLLKSSNVQLGECRDGRLLSKD